MHIKHPAQKLKTHKGWTLSELLVCTVIVGIILVVLAPVLSRRFEEDIRTGAAQNDTRLFIYDENDPDCTSTQNNSLVCKFVPPAGVKMINAVIVSGGGGGAGATVPAVVNDKVVTVANTSGTGSLQKTIKITRGMQNVKVNYISGSGGGGGGGSWDEIWSDTPPASQADCDPYDAKFLTAEQNGGYAACVTKYNVGDISKAQNWGVAPTVVLNKTGVKCTGDNCCWHGRNGRTAALCTNENGSYGGCNRAVCKYFAAKESCKTLTFPSAAKQREWRLPTVKEMTAWSGVFNTISAYQKDNGIMICGGMSGFGVAQCHHQYSCPGTQAGYCTPDHTWAEDVDISIGEFGYSSFDCNNGNFYLEMRTKQYAQSTRCIFAPEVVRPSLSGGGSGGAPFDKNYSIPDDIIKNNIDGTIKLYAAAGGTGGASASSQAGKGSDGQPGKESYIEVRNKSGALVWGLKVQGANAGKGATSTSAGSGAAQKSAASCQVYEGSWKNISCSGAGARGTDGTTLENSNETSAAQGGTGGGAAYSNDGYQGGGIGADAANVNGTKGSLWGAGGGGGTVGFDADFNPKKGKGANGANGAVEIKYDITYEAAAGGGGGGGTFAKISNIEVIGLKEYTVKVGAGGSGGTISAPGGAGGDSSIQFEGSTHTVYGGKGGSVGTSQTETQNAIQGKGGAAGTLSSGIKSSDAQKGTAGKDGSAITPDEAAGIYAGYAGGVGGDSGISTKGGCGGLFRNTSICTNNNANGTNAPNFEAPSGIFKSVNYGSAGAAGAGGGWSWNSTVYPNPGSGGKGQNGYVYLYWTKQE